MNSLVCGICGNRISNEVFIAKEMMFGTREEFQYFECSSCKTIQIADTSLDLSRHYPPDYSGHTDIPFSEPTRFLESIKRRLRYWRADYERSNINPFSIIGRLIVPKPQITSNWMLKVCKGLKHKSAVLDVGTGSGIYLMKLAQLGFSNLLGIDPFIHQDRDFASGKIKLRKIGMEELSGSFDLIMLHHSLEHMVDPMLMLRQLKRHLEPHGRILIRIPIAGCYAAHHYGSNWVQLDPPRHQFLLTPLALKLMATQTGLKLSHIIYDSDHFQFWGSEQYLKGIPLEDPRSVVHNPPNGCFSVFEMRSFAAQAEQLNDTSLGDQAAFILQHEQDANR